MTLDMDYISVVMFQIRTFVFKLILYACFCLYNFLRLSRAFGQPFGLRPHNYWLVIILVEKQNEFNIGYNRLPQSSTQSKKY